MCIYVSYICEYICAYIYAYTYVYLYIVWRWCMQLTASHCINKQDYKYIRSCIYVYWDIYIYFAADLSISPQHTAAIGKAVSQSFTPRALHLTPHTLHLTSHTSRLTPHIPHPTLHTSHFTPHIPFYHVTHKSSLQRGAMNESCHTNSSFTPHTSHTKYHIPFYHVTHKSSLQRGAMNESCHTNSSFMPHERAHCSYEQGGNFYVFEREESIRACPCTWICF